MTIQEELLYQELFLKENKRAEEILSVPGNVFGAGFEAMKEIAVHNFEHPYFELSKKVYKLAGKIYS